MTKIASCQPVTTSHVIMRFRVRVGCSTVIWRGESTAVLLLPLTAGETSGHHIGTYQLLLSKSKVNYFHEPSCEGTGIAMCTHYLYDPCCTIPAWQKSMVVSSIFSVNNKKQWCSEALKQHAQLLCTWEFPRSHNHCSTMVYHGLIIVDHGLRTWLTMFWQW